MNYYAALALLLFAYMSLWFAVSLVKKRNDIADVAWGLGFVLLAWVSLFPLGDFGARGFLVSILVSVWGLRLASHIYFRNRSRKEDYRYLAWRKEWGKWFYLRSYVQIYLLQGFLLFLIVFPVLVINRNSGPLLGWLDFIGVAVWFSGFFFEAVGDAQLAKFTKDPSNKGKIMQSGLWAYTRHPNYFGEAVLWWGIWIVSLSAQSSWFSILGPLTITLLLTKVSGIPMLEKKMSENPEFAEYKRRVSIFFPLPIRYFEKRKMS